MSKVKDKYIKTKYAIMVAKLETTKKKKIKS